MSGRPGAGPAVVIRDAAPADLPIIRSIYAYHVLHGLASFEEVPPDAAEFERRYRDILTRGLPLQAVGFKFGRWVDSVLMQLGLGPGDSRLPDR